MMGLENYKNDLRDGSLVDYYLSHYWWASKLKRLTHEQTSIYFGIIHVLLDNLKGKINMGVKIYLKTNFIIFTQKSIYQFPIISLNLKIIFHKLIKM